MKATDWTGHNWRERVFCCIALLNMEGFLTPAEHGRIVRRAERKFKDIAARVDTGCSSEKAPAKVARDKPGARQATIFHRSDDAVRWPVDDVPMMFKRQAD